MKTSMKTILVTGDWVADWNLDHSNGLPQGYFDGSLQTQLHHRAGGAWYVAHLIENVACRDLTVQPTRSITVKPARDAADSIRGLNEQGTQRDDLAYAYSVWWKHRRLNAGKNDDEVWRIGRFAGCRKSTTWVPPVADGKSPCADILVVDDLGLGFSEQPNAVEHVTSYAGNGAILLKHGVRPDGSGLLPQFLKGDLGGRLHVVTDANALRRRNAALSRALSWDKAIEDIETEFASGPSSRDLACCATAVVHFGLAGAAVFREGKLDRFYFLPDELERAWEDDRPGSSFGTGSVLTACIARHLLARDEYPLFFAVTQALAAQRVAHHDGAGKDDTPNIDLAYGVRGQVADPAMNPAAACIAPPQPNDKADVKHLAGIQSFRAAWNPDDIAVWPRAKSKGLRANRLLCNVTGTTPEALHAKALEVVIQGAAKALASIPKASYEKYVTADREEIESINEIRRLILEYKSNPEDKRPLSIAVFGAPGSGKSFAIKQIAKAIFGKDKEPLEFNLTQIKVPADLHRAFHQVRDASIRLEIPLVFWDEFDTASLKWLADFLAPMQDAEFFDGSHRHPFGKCIFVFAGGTRTTFDDFKRWSVLKDGQTWLPNAEDPWHSTFKELKGPDFISRLRGFVNVKGPNPSSPHAAATPAECIANDPAYVLRRALVLRGEIERSYPYLIHPKTNRAAIAPNVLHAFLSVERYEHGARSISALLGMSALAGVRAFMLSALPTDDLLRLHVSGDFQSRLADPVWTEQLLYILARAGHVGYCSERLKTEPGAPDAIPWEQLPEEAHQRGLDPVPRRLLELQRLGLFAVPQVSSAACPGVKAEDLDALIAQLAEPEHHIWLSDRLTLGFEWCKSNQRWLRLNTDITDFNSIAPGNKLINIAISRESLAAFEPAGFCLVRKPPAKPESVSDRCLRASMAFIASSQ